MKINKKKVAAEKEKALNLRIDQLNEQTCELIDEVKDRNAEIALLRAQVKSLEAQLAEKALLLESTRSGQLMANGIIDNYLNLIRDYMPKELIEKCQEVTFEVDDVNEDIHLAVELDDVISAIYAVTAKYFCKN